MNKFNNGSVIYTVGDIERLRAENEALSRYKTAYEEWSDKTQWVQDTCSAKELGFHRADVLKQRIDDLTAENETLKVEVEEIKAQAGRDGFIAGAFSERQQPSTIWSRLERANSYAKQLRQAAKGE